MYLTLRQRVGQEAADKFLPPVATDIPDPGGHTTQYPEPRRPRAEPLDRAILGHIAALNSWTWLPAADGSANVPYLTGLFFLAFGLAAIRGVLINASAYLSAAVTLDTVTRLRRGVLPYLSTRCATTMQTIGIAEATDLLTSALKKWVTRSAPGSPGAFRYPLATVLLIALILLVNFWLAVSFFVLAGLVWLIGGQIAAALPPRSPVGRTPSHRRGCAVKESMSLFRLVKCFQMERFNQNAR